MYRNSNRETILSERLCGGGKILVMKFILSNCLFLLSMSNNFEYETFKTYISSIKDRIEVTHGVPTGQ